MTSHFPWLWGACTITHAHDKHRNTASAQVHWHGPNNDMRVPVDHAAPGERGWGVGCMWLLLGVSLPGFVICRGRPVGLSLKVPGSLGWTGACRASPGNGEARLPAWCGREIYRGEAVIKADNNSSAHLCLCTGCLVVMWWKDVMMIIHAETSTARAAARVNLDASIGHLDLR